MGSAFIAVADDATAASWNPGGLTQLRKPEFSFVFDYNRRRENYSSADHPEASGLNIVTSEDLNYASVAYPFQLFERNMIISLNYQLQYSFDRNLDFDYNIYNPPYSDKRTVEFRQRGTLKTLSPAYCIQVTPRLALGVTFNFWTDKLFWGNGWNSVMDVTGKQSGAASWSSYTVREYERYSSFNGFNLNLGFFWNANRYLTIGGVLKTPFKAEVKHQQITTQKSRLSDGSIDVNTLNINEDVNLYMPMSYGVGVAVRLSDAFTLSCDVYRTEWSKFILEDSTGYRSSPVTGLSSKASHVHATNQVRLGAEYLFVLTKTVIPLRAGLFYDPEPGQNQQNDFWGFSLGTGVSIGDLILDIAYQFRIGRGVNGEVLDIPKTNANVYQHTFYASAIYHF
jgi:long-subunit fatty acid transport protein